jgi:hypothetical protein
MGFSLSCVITKLSMVDMVSGIEDMLGDCK